MATADRGREAGLREALGVLDRDVPGAAIAVMHEPHAFRGTPVVHRLLEGIEDELRLPGPGDAPADGEGRGPPPVRGPARTRAKASMSEADQKTVRWTVFPTSGDMDEAGPGGHVDKVREPERVGARRVE